MQAIELETNIDADGHIQLPEKYQHAFGKPARLVLLLPETTDAAFSSRRAGSAKGLLKILSEDNEYLNDFKEYMQ